MLVLTNDVNLGESLRSLLLCRPRTHQDLAEQPRSLRAGPFFQVVQVTNACYNTTRNDATPDGVPEEVLLGDDPAGTAKAIAGPLWPFINLFFSTAAAAAAPDSRGRGGIDAGDGTCLPTLTGSATFSIFNFQYTHKAVYVVHV